MKLNHIDLGVPDVQKTAGFFARYFGFRLESNPSSPAIAILSGEGGFVLVLERLKREEERYPEGFHLGFYVDDLDAVHRMHALAKSDGLEVSEVIANNRGTMIYVTAPGRILIEINHRGARAASD